VSRDGDTAGRVIATVGPKRLAEAITSPASLLVAGAAGGLAVAAAGPVGIAAGVIAWLAATLFKLRPKKATPRPSAVRIDPFAIGEPWRRYVQSAQQAKLRFDRAVQATDDSMLRLRLAEVGGRVEDALQECWTIALKAHQLDTAVRDLDVPGISNDLERIKDEARVNRDPARAAVLESTIRSVEAQLASATRMSSSVTMTEDRLRQLDAQLDELVARGIELSTSATAADDFGSFRVDVDNVVTEMEALRQAMEETSAISRGTSGTTATA
jgi:hypothetical protein